MSVCHSECAHGQEDCRSWVNHRLCLVDERVQSEGRMYRLKRNDPWHPWMYFCSHGEAMILGGAFRKEGVAQGPVQVRCIRHGWTKCGIGDVCGECADEILLESAEFREMLFTHLNARERKVT